MIEQREQIERWIASGKKLAIARVVKTWRSSPRPAGSSLIVTEDGEMLGSVSGGCVEKAVVSRAMKVLETGQAALVDYGVADEDAWEVGLSCGGALTVFIQPFFDQQLWKAVTDAQAASMGQILLTKLEDSGETQRLIHNEIEGSDLNDHLKAESIRLYETGQNGMIEFDDQRYFQQTLRPKPAMIMIGSAHISSELTGLAHLYGFETILIDPRDTFAKKTHFESQPGKVHVNWPQEVLNDYALDKDTYIVILSHDPKIDDEALKIVLKSDVAYIGALGSRKTHAKRVARLKEFGFNEEEIARIDAPIGVDIAAQGAAEIALSILGQVIKVKNS